MKRLISSILAAAFIAGSVMTAGCKGANNNPIDIPTPEPAATSVVVTVPTDVPDFTEAPTPGPTEQATEPPEETVAPTASGVPDQTVFDDAVFIGNSLFVGLYSFGVITHGKFLTKVGLNVNTVFTDPADGGTVPIIDELKTGGYKKVIIHLGLNELGWPSYTTYIAKYSDLLDAVWERIPEAKIFVVGLPPVTKTYSEASTNGINLENVNRMNALLEEMCARKGAVYVDVPASFYDAEGYLPANASADGVHMNLEFDRIWADHITLKVMGA
ncbi:MAG: hypothetical protein II897_01105 [Clostridia bacterium]|nr:hypothetical protein [Clostridia bacterium]